MSQSNLQTPGARSWRDIPQPVRPRTMGREGKKRLILAASNIVGIVLLLGACAWGVYQFGTTWAADPMRLAVPTKGVPIRDFVVRTDGVLNKAWVQHTLSLPASTSLMEFDLFVLKQRLEESRQVSKAVVERRFPDVLAITLQERTPVARVMARIGAAPPVAFMVSRDGIVYSGFGYAVEMTENLPFIDGVRLRRDGATFLPIEGMDVVADLLGTTQASAPDIYRSFEVVSLSRFALDRTLVVKSSEVTAITFGAAQDSFYRQIARLDYILGEIRARTSHGPIKSVNLAVGDRQVPILFESQPAASAGPAAGTVYGYNPPSGTDLFPLSTRNPSPTKRDF